MSIVMTEAQEESVGRVRSALAAYHVACERLIDCQPEEEAERMVEFLSARSKVEEETATANRLFAPYMPRVEEPR